MTAVAICPSPVLQFFDNTGRPAVNGSILTQVGGINTATYADSGGTTPLPNPIPLNSRGEVSTAAGATSQLFLIANTVYTFTLFDGPNGTGNQLWTTTYVNNPQVQPGATTLDVRAFGVTGNGTTDDTAALQTALNSLSPGSAANIANGLKVYVAGNLTIPANITLKGPQSFVGTMTSNSINAPYQTMGGQISLASSATITMNAGSCIDGLLIVQHGLTFPQTNATNYAGTAITYNGDDCTVKNCMILAFNQGITSSGFQRPKAFDLLMDNVSGISFSGSLDITHVERVHMWNFGTTTPGYSLASTQRTGTAFNINADGSGAKLIDCFCFGYNTGFATQGTGDVGQTFLNCWADSTGTYGTGFAVTGGATDTKLTACQASGCITGYLFSLNSGLKATMTDCNAWGNQTHGILSGSGNAGDIIIRGGFLRNNSNAISYSNAGGAGILDVDEVAFDNSNSLTFNVTVATTNLRIGSQNDFSNIATGTQLIGTSTNVALPTIASVANLLIPDTGSDFIISGNFNGVGTLTYGWAGRLVTLFFTGTPQINGSTGAYNAMRLAGGAASFTPAAGGTLTLKHNGVQWYEIGRAA